MDENERKAAIRGLLSGLLDAAFDTAMSSLFALVVCAVMVGLFYVSAGHAATARLLQDLLLIGWRP